jgi:hypothetical protein
MYMKWMVGRYCKNIAPARKRQFELKVLAEAVFKSKFYNTVLSIIRINLYRLYRFINR